MKTEDIIQQNIKDIRKLKKSISNLRGKYKRQLIENQRLKDSIADIQKEIKHINNELAYCKHEEVYWED